MKKLLVVGLAALALSGQAFAEENEHADVAKKVYDQAFGRGCGACHDVSPNPNLVQNINDGTLDEKKFKEVLEHGRNTMPKAVDAIMNVGAVKKSGLTQDQVIDALFKYLKHKK